MNIELCHIHKHFGKVHANDDIVLDIPSGTIQGILGENGAGKSTLMKVLSGFIQADSGEILLEGKQVIIKSPADAIRLGVGMLHQDPLDFPPMRLTDNFLLGRSGGLFPDHKAVARDIHDLAVQFDFSLDPEAYVDSLTVGERQQLEILRLLWLGARVLILDEPTTGISQSQKDKLFATLKKLASLVGTSEPPYQTKELVRMMFGREVTLGGRTLGKAGGSILELENVSLEGAR